MTGEALFSTVAAFRHDESTAVGGSVWENVGLKPCQPELMVAHYGQWSSVASEPSKPSLPGAELPVNELCVERFAEFAEAHQS